MHPVKGPRQPVYVSQNGKPGYTFNPLENLPVEECAPWEYSNINVSADYITEPVFSSQALYENRT